MAWRPDSGFGVVQTENEAVANTACAMIGQVQGNPVGVHVLRTGDESATWAASMPSVHAAQQPDASINTLLQCLRRARQAGNVEHAVAGALDSVTQTGDEGGAPEVEVSMADAVTEPETPQMQAPDPPATAAAAAAVQQDAAQGFSWTHTSQQPEQVLEPQQHPQPQPQQQEMPQIAAHVQRQVAAQGGLQQQPSTGGADKLGAAPAQPAAAAAKLPDDAFPRCRHLMDAYQAFPNAQNKTPVAILHDYTSRLCLETSYTESAGSALGPFSVEGRLLSRDGTILYARGMGQDRKKKEAKQKAASAVLETLLANVPLADFLPGLGKAKRPRGSVPASDAAAAALASALGAQEIARVVPVQRTMAAFGPRGPSIEDVRRAARGLPPDAGRAAEPAAAAAAASQPAQSASPAPSPPQQQQQQLPVIVDRRLDIQQEQPHALQTLPSRKRGIE